MLTLEFGIQNGSCNVAWVKYSCVGNTHGTMISKSQLSIPPNQQTKEVKHKFVGYLKDEENIPILFQILELGLQSSTANILLGSTFG